MRPVIRGPIPGNYPDPITNQGRTYNFNPGGPGTAINAIFGTYTPLVADCLLLWLSKAATQPTSPLGYPVPPGAQGSVTPALNAIQNKITTDYKLAGSPLVQNWGAYCSYCGIPVSGLLEVEHRVPKSIYPLWALSWSNFFLACGACNTAKGDKPPRATVVGWNQPPRALTEVEYSQAIGAYYYWADKPSDCYSALTPILQVMYNGNWVDVDYLLATSYRNTIVSTDVPNRRVVVNLLSIDGTKSFPGVQVQVVIRAAIPPKSPPPPPPPPPYAVETIAMCQLNNPGKAKSTYDRRMFNRTLAWFSVCQVLSLLYPLPPDQFSRMWPLVMMHSGVSGFFPVWLKVLAAYQDSGTKQYPSLASRLVHDPTLATYYPGTNIAVLPF